jgi:hypothetical protein
MDLNDEISFINVTKRSHFGQLRFLGAIDTINIKTGSSKANGRKPRSCLGRVFNFKLGCFT